MMLLLFLIASGFLVYFFIKNPVKCGKVILKGLLFLFLGIVVWTLIVIGIASL